jgi:uncharacterized protein (DUF1697 family)
LGCDASKKVYARAARAATGTAVAGPATAPAAVLQSAPVSTWVALFRGINVGGNNMLPMKDLAALLEALGLRDVRTYIQSGNVVFTASGTAGPLAGRIGAAVERRCGFRPQLLLLGTTELARALAANPFPEAAATPQFLHLWFLAGRPARGAEAALAALAATDERFVLRGKVLYLHAPRGIGNSKLAARAERALGVPATARNWRTATTLLSMARGRRE